MYYVYLLVHLIPYYIYLSTYIIFYDIFYNHNYYILCNITYSMI
jgi:hypothetical protein